MLLNSSTFANVTSLTKRYKRNLELNSYKKMNLTRDFFFISANYPTILSGTTVFFAHFR